MAMDSADACLPGPLKDFVFDLHDSARRSHLPAEQATLYTGTFKDLTSKYFAQGPWPSAKSVSGECGDDPLFLALYTELTARHLHSVSRPSVSDRIAGWHVYKKLFDQLLAEVETDDRAPGGEGLYLLPEWTFDILHEFVYQFQGFCQFRTATFAAAARGAAEGGKPAPNHVMESLKVLSEHREAWAVENVLGYLTRLVRAGTDKGKIMESVEKGGPAYRFLGLFASVALSRLECLLGDYTSSLNALAPVLDPTASKVQLGSDPTTGIVDVRTAEEVVQSCTPARISMSYHAGVSYLMLRRYRDAATTLGSIATFMQRGFKTGQLRTGAHSDQYGRQYDRIIALLAILSHVCPLSDIVEDTVLRIVRERHAAQLSKIDSGEEGYEDLFIFACPKFISANVPDYSRATAGSESTDAIPSGQDAYRLQVRQFTSEMEVQSTLRKLRSYMKLYTSIDIAKLAAFNDLKEEDFLPLLLTYKHKTRQMQRDGAGADDSPTGGELQSSALDVHFYVNDSMVHVDEAERQRRFENYFLGQIGQNSEILRDAEAVDANV